MNWQKPIIVEYDVQELIKKINSSAMSSCTSCGGPSNGGACTGCDLCFFLFISRR